MNRTKTIDELAREERLTYFREWRKNNPDKIKKHNTTYWEKRALAKLTADQAKEGTNDDPNITK